MTIRLRSHLSYANVAATAALILAMGGFAVAAIPGAGGVISACYSKRTGALRVVNASKKCKRGQKRLTWNQQGPHGVQGIQGIHGNPGAPGSAVAYAQVTSTGALVPGASKNVLGITEACRFSSTDCSDTEDSYLCLEVATTVVNAQVTSDGDQYSDDPPAVYLPPLTTPGTGSWCKAPYTSVMIYSQASSGAPSGTVDGGFFVTFN